MDLIFLAWITAFVLCMLLELSSPGLFYFLSLALGAASSAVAALFGLSLISQLILFVLVTVSAVIVLKRWVKVTARDTLHKTNVFALVGRHGMVTEPVGHESKGWVKISGELWAAYASEPVFYDIGTHVTVVKTSGSHVIVKKVTHIS